MKVESSCFFPFIDNILFYVNIKQYEVLSVVRCRGIPVTGTGKRGWWVWSLGRGTHSSPINIFYCCGFVSFF